MIVKSEHRSSSVRLCKLWPIWSPSFRSLSNADPIHITPRIALNISSICGHLFQRTDRLSVNRHLSKRLLALSKEVRANFCQYLCGNLLTIFRIQHYHRLLPRCTCCHRVMAILPTNTTPRTEYFILVSIPQNQRHCSIPSHLADHHFMRTSHPIRGCFYCKNICA